MSSITFCTPKEHINSDGTAFVEKIPGHYVMFIPNEIKRDFIIDQISQPSVNLQSKKKSHNPNRVHNSFILYRMEKTREITKQNSTINQTVVSQMIGKLWKSESVETKKRYKAKSELLKQRSQKIATLERSGMDDDACIRIEFTNSNCKTPKINCSDLANTNHNKEIKSQNTTPLNNNNVQVKKPNNYLGIYDKNIPTLPNSAQSKRTTTLFSSLDEENRKLSNYTNSSLGKHRRSVSKPLIESDFSDFFLNYYDMADTSSILSANNPLDFSTQNIPSTNNSYHTGAQLPWAHNLTKNLEYGTEIISDFSTETLNSGSLDLLFNSDSCKSNMSALGNENIHLNKRPVFNPFQLAELQPDQATHTYASPTPNIFDFFMSDSSKSSNLINASCFDVDLNRDLLGNNTV
ncbi:hypothetical protein BB561_000173 [Smittium simulii]|uniref:HMG box domain-containing protein n=1 Tax=Smittium simulii TaxID=133385 RepID=A0A2T9Z014_9FUNG|nr:hypothetical protein BB561_000173 [Smittium simulii]